MADAVGSHEERSPVTPTWLLTCGIVGNEDRFAQQFLPPIREWAKSEVNRLGLAGRIDPEDLSQQVFMRIFERFRHEPFSRESGAGGFHAFLRRTVHHAAVDALRASKALYRGIHLDQIAWDEIKAGTDSLADRFGTAWAHDMALVRKALDRVRHRIGAARWEAFHLLVVEGLKAAEVAARLAMKPSQVYNARHDIKAYLCEELKELGFRE